MNDAMRASAAGQCLQMLFFGIAAARKAHYDRHLVVDYRWKRKFAERLTVACG
jgi:glucose-6-phosphate-specific signal transduction histidine kinase